MSNITTWLNISGIPKEEILEGMGFEIEEGKVRLNGITYLDSDGNEIYVKDVLAVIGKEGDDLNFPAYGLLPKGSSLRKLSEYFSNTEQKKLTDDYDSKEDMACEDAGYCHV